MHAKTSANYCRLVILQKLLLLPLQTRLTASCSAAIRVSRYQKGKTSLDLNKARDDGVLGWQWHQLDHMQTICTSLQTDNHTNTTSINVYRSNALPDAQPSVRALKAYSLQKVQQEMYMRKWLTDILPVSALRQP